MLFIEQKEVASLSSALSNRLGLCMQRSILALVLTPLEEIRVWLTRDTQTNLEVTQLSYVNRGAMLFQSNSNSIKFHRIPDAY